MKNLKILLGFILISSYSLAQPPIGTPGNSSDWRRGGNFFDEIQTDTLYFGGPPYWASSSYYFIDDICVTTDSLYNETWTSVTELGGGNFSNAFSVFPNPASNFLTVNSDLHTAFDIEVYNTVGQLLYNKQNLNTNNLQLDISSYNNGLLFIKITSQSNQFMYKLLKQ